MNESQLRNNTAFQSCPEQCAFSGTNFLKLPSVVESIQARKITQTVVLEPAALSILTGGTFRGSNFQFPLGALEQIVHLRPRAGAAVANQGREGTIAGGGRGEGEKLRGDADRRGEPLGDGLGCARKAGQRFSIGAFRGPGLPGFVLSLSAPPSSFLPSRPYICARSPESLGRSGERIARTVCVSEVCFS